MDQMQALIVNNQGDWEFVQRDIPNPGPNEIRIKIHACGVCHSDAFIKQKLWPNLQLPRIPGHEVAGVVDAIGNSVTKFKPGQRVGVGWAGFHCGQCNACLHGDFILCAKHQITGINYDGGYAEYMIAPVEAVAAIPDALSFEDAAPLMCAGITTFNALRSSGAVAGDLVAIQGIGGLGHLGIQFANKMGFQTVAISKGDDKQPLAIQLGAHIYINTEKESAAYALKQLGGAKIILATAPSGKAISPLVAGLGNNGKLLIVAAPLDPLEISALELIGKKRSIQGFASGSAIDSEETLKFCALTGIRPMIQKYPFKQAVTAFDDMMTNKVRFRSVITLT